MKEKIFAVVIFILTIGFVTANTIVVYRQISELSAAVSDFDPSAHDAKTAQMNAQKIYDDFKKKEVYISITVNHEDLTNIENCFSEMIGYLAEEKISEAKVIKHRLMDALEHLRRLSGANFDAII